MSDIRLTWNSERGAADLTLAANDLATDGGLETAILLSLFCNRRANDADVLPAGVNDRQGWWADAFPLVEGDKFGSRLWTLARATQNEVLQLAPGIVQEALAWLVADKVATKFDVTAEIVRSGTVALPIQIYRPHTDPVRYRYQYTWAAQAVRRG